MFTSRRDAEEEFFALRATVPRWTGAWQAQSVRTQCPKQTNAMAFAAHIQAVVHF